MAALKFLVPPPLADAPGGYRWRVVVSILLAVNIMTLYGYIAFASGLLTFTGFTGYARADAVQDVKEQVRQIQVAQFDSKIQADRERQCKLPKDNFDARDLMAQRLQWEMQVYRQLTGQDYPLPSCDQF